MLFSLILLTLVIIDADDVVFIKEIAFFFLILHCFNLSRSFSLQAFDCFILHLWFLLLSFFLCSSVIFNRLKLPLSRSSFRSFCFISSVIMSLCFCLYLLHINKLYFVFHYLILPFPVQYVVVAQLSLHNKN